MNIAQSALAPACDRHFLSVLFEIGESLSGIRVAHQGADRDPDGFVLATVPVLVLPTTMLAPLGLDMGAIAEVEQGGQSRRGFHVDMAAIAAVPA